MFNVSACVEVGVKWIWARTLDRRPKECARGKCWGSEERTKDPCDTKVDMQILGVMVPGVQGGRRERVGESMPTLSVNAIMTSNTFCVKKEVKDCNEKNVDPSYWLHSK